MIRRMLVFLLKIAYKTRNTKLITLAEFLLLYNTKLFDARFYVIQRYDLLSYKHSLLLHFVRHGYKEGLAPFPLFNTKYYRYNNRDVKYNPIVHYLVFGEKENRCAHPIFDAFFYKTYYNLYNTNGETYLEHYIKRGAALGYMPNSVFVENTSNTLYFFNSALSCITNNPKCFAEIKEGLKARDFYKVVLLFEFNYKYNKALTQNAQVNIGSSVDYADRRVELQQETNDINKFEGLNYPHSYLAFYTDVKIIGGTKFVLKNETIINDELYEFRSRDYGVKACRYFERHPENDELGLLKNVRIDCKNKISKGVLISSDHDLNYFHWLVECLPMVECVLNSPLCDGFPLLVSRELHPNLKAALRKLVDDKREIIEIDSGCVYDVADLIVPAGLSRILDRYRGKLCIENDVVLGPFWISEVRKKLRRKSPRPPYRKFYLTRRSGTYRKLLNEEEIEFELLKHGFEIIDLAKSRFEFQVELFSQASIVVAPTGATITNILLMPEECTVLALLSNHELAQSPIMNGLDVGLWAQLAKICGVSYKQCNGKRVYARSDMHDDYYIDVNILLTELKDYVNEQ